MSGAPEFLGGVGIRIDVAVADRAYAGELVGDGVQAPVGGVEIHILEESGERADANDRGAIALELLACLLTATPIFERFPGDPTRSVSTPSMDTAGVRVGPGLASITTT